MLRQCKSVSKDWRKNSPKDDPESIPSIESKCQALELEESFANTLMSFKSNSIVPDSICWKPNCNGSFSIKSCYEAMAHNGASNDKTWRLVWSSIAPPKVTTFAWHAVHRRIPTSMANVAKVMLPLGGPLDYTKLNRRTSKMLDKHDSFPTGPSCMAAQFLLHSVVVLVIQKRNHF
ncbi:hypothetical protein V6N13_116615 [Hibiscus sabdariffa]